MSMVHEITTGTLRNKLPTRKGRGRRGGKGKTSGRGHKGAAARAGAPHWKPGHEGGQTSIFRRFPKRGFSNFNFERRFHIVNVADLEMFDNGATVDAAALIEKGLVPDDKQPVKILGEGAITKKLTVVAGKYSKSAFDKIQQAGGAAQNLKGETFTFPKPKKKFVPRDDAKKGGGKKKKADDAGGDAPAAPAAAEAPKSE